MKISHTVKFINENTVDELIKYIENKKLIVEDVIDSSKRSRTEYGLKVQELIDRLKETQISNDF